VDNPRDPGGVTGAGGITLRAVKLRDFDRDGKLDFDLDHDGDVDRVDMLALRADDPRVAEIYLDDYWILVRPRSGQIVTCGTFGPLVALCLFDCCINSGPRTAVALLQRAIGATPDGMAGPKTLALAKGEVLEAFVAERSVFYARQETRQHFGDMRAFAAGTAPPVFLRGWARRLARVQTKCIEMGRS